MAVWSMRMAKPKPLNLPNKALQRSWRKHWIYPLLFIIAMLLSLSTYLTLDSIQRSVDSYVADNQRALVGGDVVVTSRQAWDTEIETAVNQVDTKQRVHDYQFNAMVSHQSVGNTQSDDTSLLARIKAVSAAYPLYGTVILASGKPLWAQLQPNTVVVEAQVLTGLGVAVGDSIKIGEAHFTISDELLTEPDRPLTAFGFGARVLMSATDVEKTQLMGQRSRINYRIELAGNADEMTDLKNTLTALAKNKPEITVEDSNSSQTSISRISDNVLSFLKLLVIAVLFLAAVANLSVIHAFVDLQRPSNAMRRALGEPIASIKRSYYRVFLFTTMLGFMGSVLLSLLMLHFGASYLAAVLPQSLDISINALSVLKVGIVAVVMTLLMLQHSLHAVTHTKPSAVLKQDGNSPTRHRPTKSWYAVAVILAFALMAYEFASIVLGLQILGGMVLLVGGFWLLAKGWLMLLSKWVGGRSNKPAVGWMRRIAIHNLSRKGNQSALFFVTLALSVSVLSMIALLNHSLTQQFINAYPEDAPNLFLLDVQPDQQAQLNTMIAAKTAAPITYYPVVRARISDINGTPAKAVQSGTGDDPTRVFNLSYADNLLETEFISKSINAEQLYAPIPANHNGGSDAAVPMSILDTAADMLGVGLGDRVRFNIQGIEIVGQITSIRARFERGPSPFFYFLFQPQVLADAPQLQFATTQVPPADIAQLQTDLARTFPAITSIDGGAIAKRVQGFVAQMSQLVYVFTLLAILTGLMVLITSLLATSQDRLRDSASFRLLGMQTRDLYRMNCLEIGLLGASAGAFGVVGASVAAWVLITQWFDLRFAFAWQTFALGGVVLMVLLLGIAISYVRFVIGRGIMMRVRGMV